MGFFRSLIGPATPPLTFAGKAKRLDAWDFGRIAKRIGVGEDEIRAVVEVEASGSGFDDRGRVKMLFEPHRFYIEVDKAHLPKAIESGVAYRKWGEKPYPKDSYPRLMTALKFGEEDALRSASWGLGQIMGFNHKLAGYRTARDMVNAFADDEETHLDAMVSFIVSAGLDDDLRRHDWKGFARGYNGPKYYVHGYDRRLAAAFEKWRGRPDVDQP
jgi:hypothetical protein